MKAVITCASYLAITLFAVSVNAESKLSDLVVDGATPQKIVGDCKFTEGPAWHPNGFLLFSDIPNQRIIKVNPDGSSSDFLTDSKKANGLMCDKAGNIYACQGGAGQVALISPDAKVQGYLATEFEGKPFNAPNDLALDGQGGIYFTDPKYGGDINDRPQKTLGVYYVSKNGSVTQVLDWMTRPNGVTVSPDGKNLYVARIDDAKIIKFKIDGPGKISDGETIFTGDEELDGRGPDGMSHDSEGNLYTTYKGIVVLNPNGKLIGRIPVPEKPANCSFGGEDHKTLFITARKSLYSVDMKVKGMELMAKGPEVTVKDAEVAEKSVKPKATTGKTVEFKAGNLTLNLPASWKSMPPSNRMRLGQFQVKPVEGDEDMAELAVFTPMGGTVDANMQFWLKKFDKQNLKSKIVEGKSSQGTYYFVDLTGTYNKPIGPPIRRQSKPTPGYRMLSAMILTDKGNYFIRLTGQEKTIATLVEPFRKSFGGDVSTEKEYKIRN